ncbi:hypothetical protein [Streptomyces sp. KR55]|uniref:hypothetical protein n=1 Tax=Streptomyces sp. KR55 TaxID=3457425 RepID=UPI003FD59AE2
MPIQHPYAVVPGSQLLRMMVLEFALEDPELAGALGEADTEPRGGCPGTAQCPPRSGPLSAPCRWPRSCREPRIPLVAVVQRDGGQTRTVGAINAVRLMEYFLTRA